MRSHFLQVHINETLLVLMLASTLENERFSILEAEYLNCPIDKLLIYLLGSSPTISELDELSYLWWRWFFCFYFFWWFFCKIIIKKEWLILFKKYLISERTYYVRTITVHNYKMCNVSGWLGTASSLITTWAFVFATWHDVYAIHIKYTTCI